MIRTNYRLAGAVLLCSVLLFSGSCRRPTEDEVGRVAKVPLTIDWSQSNIAVDEIHRVSVWVFPHDGTTPYDIRLQGDVTQGILELPMGKYALVVFNETVDPTDRPGLRFVGREQYTTFCAVTAPDDFRGIYTQTEPDGTLFRKSPERLASWSLDEFEVTADMVVYTRDLLVGQPAAPYQASAREAVTQELSKLHRIVPKPRVKVVAITARVQNLVSAQKASGAIKGAVVGVNLSTGQAVLEPVSHIFVLNGRKYDDPTNPGHGTLGAVVHVFDVVGADRFAFELHTDFLLHNGVIHNKVFDITPDLKKEAVHIFINVGFNASGRSDDEIPLPIIPESAGAIEVDQWKDVIVPID